MPRSLILSIAMVILSGLPGRGQQVAAVAPGYTAEFSASVQETDSGKSTVVYTETRWVSANGNWRSRQQLADGRTVEKFGEPAQGVFKVDHQEKRVLRQGPFIKRNGPNVLSSGNTKHISSEIVAGLQTEVFQVSFPNGEAFLYRAPQLGDDVVKIIRKDKKRTFTLEPTHIQVGEPAAEQLHHPNYPAVDNKH